MVVVFCSAVWWKETRRVGKSKEDQKSEKSKRGQRECACVRVQMFVGQRTQANLFDGRNRFLDRRHHVLEFGAFRRLRGFGRLKRE
jgi:hypothetical protein